MMRFGAYVLFTFCVGIGLWFMGFQSPVAHILGIYPGTAGQAYAPTGEGVYQGRPMEVSGLLTQIGAFFSSPTAIGQILGIAIVTSALTGFSSMYFIPVILLLFVTNFVVMPIAPDVLGPTCVSAANPQACTAAGGSMPPTIYYPLLLLFNLITVMASMSFIRGGV